MPCLVVSGLVVSPGGGFTAGPLDIDIERGELLSLVGPSGCGKTTLIRALAGLLPPSQGRIELDGQLLNDPAPLVPPGARRIGMLFQNLSLWPHMRAVDQVAFALKGWRKRDRARALLVRLGLAGKERCRPGELSGGEGQRVALARALAGDPALLLLDEPLRSVDPHLRAEIGALLKELVRERKVACLLVTHDREEALTLGDRLAVMSEGRILGIGSGPQLRDDPPHPFVRAFLAGAVAPAVDAPDRMETQAAYPQQVAPTPPARGGAGPLLRLGLLALLLGVGVASTVLLAGKRPQAVKPLTFSSSAQCKPCHLEVYAEWQESWHAKAWTNPLVRQLSNDFRDRECLSCHAPRPIMETGIDQRVLPRTTRLNEGVDCLACHLDAEGRIMGLRNVPTAPCAPVRNDVLAGNDICAPCHNQHFTMDQWADSPAARKGQTCNDCHMLEASRRLSDGTTRPGRSHVYPGGNFPEMLLQAVELSVERQGRQIAIAVTNVFAGHNFPTDSRHKASDVLIRFREGDRWSGWTRVARFRWPYRSEPGPNTQLLAGERRELPLVPIPSLAEEAEVRLDYRVMPFVPDEGAVEASAIRHVPADRAVILHTHRLALP